MKMVDADAVKKSLGEMIAFAEKTNDFKTYLALSDAMEVVDKATRIVIRKERNGKWDCGTGLCVCSNCGKSPHYVYIPKEDWNFCPNCGARMERNEE